MRRILTMTLLAIGLTGGVALADSPRERRFEQRQDRRFEQRQDRRIDRQADRRMERVERFRDHRYRPSSRYERFEYRRGFHFVSGQWTWNGYEWTWIPGHYVRNYR